MAKYLYGASVQGIQEYIYATNDLQEIIGASEILDSLGRKFDEEQGAGSKIFGVFDKLRQDGLVEQILLNAAGNFRAIVDGEGNLKPINSSFYILKSRIMFKLITLNSILKKIKIAVKPKTVLFLLVGTIYLAKLTINDLKARYQDILLNIAKFWKNNKDEISTYFRHQSVI